MIWKRLNILLLTLVLAGFGCRIWLLNTKYPSPKEQTREPGDCVRLEGYAVTFTDWRWSDGEILHELCPGFHLLTDEEGNEYPVSQERIGLALLTIEKVGAEDDELDLTSIAFESGSWGNQFDMELMYLLNPQLESLRPQLEEGERMEILLPMALTDQQFTQDQWKGIDSRTFYVVLEHYPHKTRFRCK